MKLKGILSSLAEGANKVFAVYTAGYVGTELLMFYSSETPKRSLTPEELIEFKAQPLHVREGRGDDCMAEAFGDACFLNLEGLKPERKSRPDAVGFINMNDIYTHQNI